MSTTATTTQQTTLHYDVHVSNPVTFASTLATWPGPDTRKLTQTTIPSGFFKRQHQQHNGGIACSTVANDENTND